jgi:hypothetical protein
VVLSVASAPRRRLRGLASRHLRSKAIAAAGHCLDTAPVRPPIVEHPAQRRYLYCQVAVFDHGCGPDSGDDLVFRNDLARPLDQDAKNVEAARADRDRLKRAGTIAAEQPTAAPVEAEVLEEKNVRGASPCIACLRVTASLVRHAGPAQTGEICGFV